jgi:hypothetical protein
MKTYRYKGWTITRSEGEQHWPGLWVWLLRPRTWDLGYYAKRKTLKEAKKCIDWEEMEDER